MKKAATRLALSLAMLVGITCAPCLAQGTADVGQKGTVSIISLDYCVLPDATQDGPGFASLDVTCCSAPEGAIVTKARLSAVVSHAQVSDVTIALAADQGTTLTLWDQLGGATDEGLDDDAANDADVEYVVRDVATTFAGQLLNQVWHLQVWDHVPGNTGMLLRFELELEYAEGQPVQQSVEALGANAGGWTSQDEFPRMLGDVNGDERADLVGFGERSVFVSLSNGDGFDSAEPWISAFCPMSGRWTRQTLYPRCCGDVTGDGRADIVGFGDNSVYVAISNGSSFASPQAWLTGMYTRASGWTSQDDYPRTLGDVNGDDLADVVAFHDAGVYVSLSTGSGFAPAELWLSDYGKTAGGWQSQELSPRMLADVNGDGMLDVVGFGTRAVHVAYSTGERFAWPTPTISCFGTSTGGWCSQDAHPRMAADLDGDGDADLVGFGGLGVYVSLAAGKRHRCPWLWSNQLASNAGNWSSQDRYPRMLGDIDGDGRADIVACGCTGTYVSLSR